MNDRQRCRLGAIAGFVIGAMTGAVSGRAFVDKVLGDPALAAYGDGVLALAGVAVWMVGLLLQVVTILALRRLHFSWPP